MSLSSLLFTEEKKRKKSQAAGISLCIYGDKMRDFWKVILSLTSIFSSDIFVSKITFPKDNNAQFFLSFFFIWRYRHVFFNDSSFAFDGGNIKKNKHQYMNIISIHEIFSALSTTHEISRFECVCVCVWNDMVKGFIYEFASALLSLLATLLIRMR